MEEPWREEQICEHVRSNDGTVFDLIEDRLKEAKAAERMWDEARYLEMWAKSDPLGSKKEVLKFTERLSKIKSVAHQQSRATILKACCTFLPLIDAEDRFVELFENSGRGKHWCVLLAQTTPENPIFEWVLENALKDVLAPGPISQIFLALKSYPEIYQRTFDAMLDEVGRDRDKLKSLLRVVVEAGDLENANIVRMKVTKKNRDEGNIILGRAAIRQGNISAGMFLLGELAQNDFHTTNRFMEVIMKALIRDCGDGISYICELHND